MKRVRRPLETIGWREWAALPDLGITAVNVKVDTGARSSALHAWGVRRFVRDGERWVRFQVHPVQGDDDTIVECEAPLAGMKWVRSSSGKLTFRPIVHTTLLMGRHRYSIHLSLVRRDVMGFRMLLGRQALRGRFLVSSGRSFLQSARQSPAGADHEPPEPAPASEVQP